MEFTPLNASLSILQDTFNSARDSATADGMPPSLVWITKAFNLEWLLNLWERGKPQNKPSEKRAVTQLENANLKDTIKSSNRWWHAPKETQQIHVPN